MLNIKSHNSRGFTLIELILYIALVSIFITGAVLFSWDLIFGRVKSEVQREVNQNLRLSAQRILFEIRNASSINSLNATDLCLESADPNRNPTRIYLQDSRLRIAWGGGSGNCTGLIVDEPLTSNKVVVSNLEFINLTSGVESGNIKFLFTIESLGSRSEWNKSQSYQGAAEIRSYENN
jgi:prepilin-type N-terminal cleavage/methylation domain-containing protein